MHAWTAWAFTAAIDQFAYKNVNMRHEIAKRVQARERRRRRRQEHLRVVDIGCGAGTLTYELARTGSIDVVGVDTSHEMISVARTIVRHPHVRFEVCNGIDVVGDYDVAIVCMVMHELPPLANAQLLCHLRRSCAQVWVVDIAPTYVPSETMLSGEPYLLEYLHTIETIVRMQGREACVSTDDVVPGHVRLWKIE